MPTELKRFYTDLSQFIDLQTPEGQPLNFRQFTLTMRDPKARESFYEQTSQYVDLGPHEEFNKSIGEGLKEIPEDYASYDTDIGRFSSGLGSFVQSFTSVIAGVPESVAILSKKLAQVTGLPDKPLSEYATYELGQDIKKVAADLFPTNPKYQEEFFTTTLAQGAGSLAGFVSGGLIAKGLKISVLATSAFLGSTTVSADEYHQALQETGDEETAFKTWLANLPWGASEAIPINRAFQRIDRVTGGGIKKILSKSLQFVKGGLEEMIQETFQQFMSNATAKQIYNAERSLTAGVREGGLSGFILGMALNAMGISAKVLGRNAPTFGKTPTEGELADLNATQSEVSAEERVRQQVKSAIGVSETGGEFEAETAVQFLRGLSQYTGKNLAELVEFGVGKNLIDELKGKTIDSLSEVPELASSQEAFIVGKHLSDKAETEIREEVIKLNKEVLSGESRQIIGGRDQLLRESLFSKTGKFITFNEQTGQLDESELPSTVQEMISGAEKSYLENQVGVQFFKDGRAFVSLTQSSDVSTIVRGFAQVAKLYLNVSDQKISNELTDEEFTTSFESWVSSGRTSNPRLKTIFQKLRLMFEKIYSAFHENLGVEFSPQMEALFDRMTGGVELMGQEDQISHAQSQVDESYWLNQLYGEDEEGRAKSNEGERLNTGTIGVDPEVIAKGKNEAGDISYNRPNSVWWLSQKSKFPLHIFNKLRRNSTDPSKPSMPEMSSLRIIWGDLAVKGKDRDYESHYKKLRPAWWRRLATERSTVKEIESKIPEAVGLIHKIRSENVPITLIEQAKKELANLYVKYPELQQAIDGVDGRGGLIQLLEQVKEETKASKRKQYEIDLDEFQFSVFKEVVDEGRKTESAVRRNTDVITLAKEKYIQNRLKKPSRRTRKRRTRDEVETSWNELTADERTAYIDKTVANLVSKLNRDVIDPYKDIDTWGIQDYFPHVELGNYAIYDGKDRRVGFGRNHKEAKNKAYKLRQELKAQGEDPGLYEIKAEPARVDPTAKREFKIVDEKGKELARTNDFDEARKKVIEFRKEGKWTQVEHGILKGDNIFDILPIYIHAMNKRNILGPIQKQIKKEIKENPDIYTPDLIAILHSQMKAAQGSTHGWIDNTFDRISFAFGWETGKAAKWARGAKWITAVTKLGYRPVATALNAMSGFGMTYTKVGNEVYVKAQDVYEGETRIYKGLDGVEVDMLQKIKDIEDEHRLGTTLGVDASGNIKQKLSVFHPLGPFTRVERPVREFGFIANYILQREKFGLNDADATIQAIENMYFQQATYNAAAIPEMLRGTGGSVVGQFKAYFINHLQFVSSLRGWEIPRYLGVSLVIGGPRALIYFLKTVPILLAFGLDDNLDDLERWIITGEDPLAVVSRGVPGLLGADISAPATFQFPQQPLEWLGPIVAETVSLTKDVITPAVSAAVDAALGEEAKDRPGFLTERGINWAEGLAPIYYYLNQFLDSVVLAWDYTGEKDPFAKRLWDTYHMPDIWIRDSQNNLAYPVGGAQDRLLLALGASPIVKSDYSLMKQHLERKMEIRKDNRKILLRRITRKLNEGELLSDDDLQDMLIYDLNPESIPNAFKWQNMTPEMREVWKQSILDRADAIDIMGLE